MEGKSTRIGTYKCYQCRKPFTVKVGTVFESSHVPLHLWLQAMFLLARSKKGISSNQLHRTLGVTLKTAWFMSHRIRVAMKAVGLEPMGGAGKIVEIDETYIGGYRRAFRRHGAAASHKNVVLIWSNAGLASSQLSYRRATKETRLPDRASQRAKGSAVTTDEGSALIDAWRAVRGHDTVNHRAEEYVRDNVSHQHGRRLLLDLQARHEGHLSALRRAAPAPLSGRVRFPLQPPCCAGR